MGKDFNKGSLPFIRILIYLSTCMLEGAIINGIEASASCNIRLGVYSDNNGTPGSVLLDAGETACRAEWVSIDDLALNVTHNTC